MAKPHLSVSSRSPADGDGNPIGSRILLSLPRKEYNQIFAELELVRLKLHQVIHEAGETIKSGYFVNSGLISVLAVQPDGKSIEVGLIGREGFVGLPLLVGYHTSPTRIVTQGDGSAYRCDARALIRVMRECPELQQRLHRFSQQLAMQTTQIAACNRLHNLEERLARWILMTQDRLLSETLPLTQEFLAQMLGTRRATVTVAAGILQKAGLISYTRGNVAILERKQLEEAACDCYEIVQHQLKEWENETKGFVRNRTYSGKGAD
ncbi:MAG: Crp/Fnr family transcriptional regulator [Acidobacteria bacterium]|nr:MAG: Crp/Fnr family transcriptional regulator [Acidobacteriota bacterium]